MLERLPPGARTPAMARAVTSPSAVLLAGAGASVAILGGLPLVAAAAVGAACWAGRVALALPRRKREERIDPFAVGEPWRTFVREAQEAHQRYGRAVRGTDAGPLRDRLEEMGQRIGVAVRECWKVAKRGDALDAAVSELDIPGLQRQLAILERELTAGPSRPDLQATATSLRHQLESAERLWSVDQETRDRLLRLDAELDEAVARAIELSLHGGDADALSPLGGDVENLVGELESLRQGLEEASPR